MCSEGGSGQRVDKQVEGKRMRANLTVRLLSQLLLGASILEGGELPKLEPLNALWKQYMLEHFAFSCGHILNWRSSWHPLRP